MRPTDVDVSRTLGHAIRERRVLLGISQESLAADLGLTFQQLQKYENASNRVSVPVLFRIASALKCTPEELVHDVSRGRVHTTLSPMPRTSLETVRALGRLSHDKRAAVLRFV